MSEGAKKTLTELAAYAARELDGDMRDMLLKYGLSFDVVLKEGKVMQFVEVNPFGGLSGCGACLFNWVRDGKMLYGLKKAEFAVTLASSESRE